VWTWKHNGFDGIKFVFAMLLQSWILRIDYELRGVLAWPILSPEFTHGGRVSGWNVLSQFDGLDYVPFRLVLSDRFNVDASVPSGSFLFKPIVNFRLQFRYVLPCEFDSGNNLRFKLRYA
jgi:hypothetical protein